MARNEKNSVCDFFSHSGNFDAISCKKMQEYREIAPENYPCSVNIDQPCFIACDQGLYCLSLPLLWDARHNPVNRHHTLSERGHVDNNKSFYSIPYQMHDYYVIILGSYFRFHVQFHSHI